MKNKLIPPVFAVLAALISAFAISGCGEDANSDAAAPETTAAATADSAPEVTTVPQGGEATFFDLTYNEPFGYKSVEDKEITDETPAYTARGYELDGYMLVLNYIKNTKIETLMEDESLYSDLMIGDFEYKILLDGAWGSALLQNGDDAYVIRYVMTEETDGDEIQNRFSALLHSIKTN